MAMFYRREQIEALTTNHFWLSDPPEVSGSTTWGNTCRRMATWLKFRDRNTAGEFLLCNTHFDHEIQRAREESAKLNCHRNGALESKLPVLLGGGFNADAGANKAYELLIANDFLADAWTATRERRGDGVGTFNRFQPGPPKDHKRRDWILTRGGVTVDRAEIVSFSRTG
jgi:hypothetical protein